MKIKSKKELKFFIQADRMMNRGHFLPSLKIRIKNFFSPDYIMDFLYEMRQTSYYRAQSGKINRLLLAIHSFRYRKLGLKLGFSIGENSLGYGVVIPHYGTIVVGDAIHIGNYAVLHTSICITNNEKKIGDAFYCSAGVKVTSKVVIGDNVSVGANSLVNKDCEQNNVLLGGMPAKVIRQEDAWYIRDSKGKSGNTYYEKVKKVEELKRQYGL